jgi:hypothetical protein
VRSGGYPDAHEGARSMNRCETALVMALLSVASCRSAPGPELLAQLKAATGGYLGGDDDWWDPNANQNIRTGQVPRDVGGYLNIGMDDTARDAVLVYVFQFGP